MKIQALASLKKGDMVFLSERKRTLSAEVVCLRKIQEALKNEHKKMVAHLQHQQSELDEKNGALKTTNEALQKSNNALKQRVTHLSTEFFAHRCTFRNPSLSFYNQIVVAQKFNELRKRHNLAYPGAPVEEFLGFLKI